MIEMNDSQTNYEIIEVISSKANEEMGQDKSD